MNLLIYKYASVLSSTDSPASFRLTRGRNLPHNGTIFRKFRSLGVTPCHPAFHLSQRGGYRGALARVGGPGCHRSDRIYGGGGAIQKDGWVRGGLTEPLYLSTIYIPCRFARQGPKGYRLSVSALSPTDRIPHPEKFS